MRQLIRALALAAFTTAPGAAFAQDSEPKQAIAPEVAVPAEDAEPQAPALPWQAGPLKAPIGSALAEIDLPGKYKIDIGADSPTNRTGEAFWTILRRNGVPADIWRIPANFPVEPSEGVSFSGMMTPALDSAYGQCTFFTTDPLRKTRLGYSKTEQLQEFSRDGVIELNQHCATQTGCLPGDGPAFPIRIDVAEELTRLNAHLDEIDRLLRAGGEVGKRLDFLIQELHREANTLGSKSVDARTSQAAVDLKVIIEQLRERDQVDARDERVALADEPLDIGDAGGAAAGVVVAHAGSSGHSPSTALGLVINMHHGSASAITAASIVARATFATASALASAASFSRSAFTSSGANCSGNVQTGLSAVMCMATSRKTAEVAFAPLA